MAVGLTRDGFEIPTVSEITAEVHAHLKENADPNINLAVDQPLGQVIAILVGKIHDLWVLAKAVYHAAYPDGASGVPLTHVAAITGTRREVATKSKVTATVNLNAGTTLPEGSGASVAGDSTMTYVTTQAVSNNTGAAADFDVTMEATVTGSHIRANAGTLTVIDTPVAGWNSITNALDSESGTDEEEDVDLRDRREDELARPGTATLPALRADLLDITTQNGFTSSVISAEVFENTAKDPADENGLPIWKVECVVEGGDNAEIAEVIFRGKPGGVGTFGSSSETVVAADGREYTIYFSKVVTVPISVALQVHKAFGTTLTNDEIIAAVKNAVANTYGNTVGQGEDVNLSDVIAAANGAAGVEKVVVSGSTPTINGLTEGVEIRIRERASIDTSNVAVSVVDA